MFLPKKGYFSPPVVIILALITLTVAVVIYFNRGLILKSKENQPAPPSANQQSPQVSPKLSPTPDETADWEVYRNDKYKFKFSYPEAWQLIETADEEVFGVHLEKEGISIHFIVNAPGIGLSGAKFESIKVDKVNSSKASIIVDNQVVSIYVFPENKNVGIILDSIGPTQITQDSIKDFDQILSTFKFLE